MVEVEGMEAREGSTPGAPRERVEGKLGTEHVDKGQFTGAFEIGRRRPDVIRGGRGDDYVHVVVGAVGVVGVTVE